MDTLLQAFKTNDLYLITIIVCMIGLILINFYNLIKIQGLSRKYRRFMRSLSGTNIEQSLEKYLEEVKKAYAKTIEIERRCGEIDRDILNCFQKIGVVRFNAFEDVGSDLSYAIALLDAFDNGIILNGIYSRESSATYAKPVLNGESKYVLSAEEMQALEIAKKNINKKVG